ncbi:MAG: prepilin-type N-terminal cleavage/methylation domain-containing protein [Desulfobacterales bacterium]|jgi:MSHA pilin protein MshC
MNLKNASGFTIIEIITVLIVMGIITAFVIGRAGSNRTDLVVQAEVLKAHLRFAQTQAVNSTLNFGIESDAGGNNYWLFKYDTSKVPPVVKIKLPNQSADQVNLSGSGLSITASAIVCFDDRGVPYTDHTASTIQAADRSITISDGSTSITTTITKNTGFIP